MAPTDPAHSTAAPPAGTAAAIPDRAVDRSGPGRSRRLLVFRILAVVPVLVFTVNATNLLAPWTFVMSSGEPHPEANRWFFTVSAAADLFALVSFAGLVVRPRLTALAATIAMSLAVVMVAIVPLQPTFLVFLCLFLPAVLAYPYWRDLREWRSWLVGVRRPLALFACVVAAVVLVTSVTGFVRQLTYDDAASAQNWWNDYAEHSADIALVGLIAVTTAPGRLLLRGVLAAVWVYLGCVAAFALPDANGSWGVAGGLAAMAVGLVFGIATLVDLRRRTVPVPRPRASTI